MEQHAVPQHIASYEFRLVGDMTFKQFAYVAGGIVVALLFYATPLHPLLKWPLIFFFGFSGICLAFVPIQERPLSQWLLAFTKAVFSPTQYLWQKQQADLEMFKTQAVKTVVTKAPVPQADKEKLGEFLQTLPGTQVKNTFDQQEEKFFQQTATLFQNVKPLPPLPQTPLQPQKPAVEAKISPTLPIPGLPSRPNILVGMVLDQRGEIIEGAILEIKNSRGIPVRALRTNRLGQFLIATPLENDSYEIETEKEGFRFDIIKITTQGELIPPIEIRAK